VVKNICRTCRYSEFTKTDDFDSSQYSKKGSCRRFPPVFVNRATWGDFVFPEIDADGWCGEWKKREVG